MKQVIA
jgi:type I site-specific restriction endonuclease